MVITSHIDMLNGVLERKSRFCTKLLKDYDFLRVRYKKNSQSSLNIYYNKLADNPWIACSKLDSFYSYILSFSFFKVVK